MKDRQFYPYTRKEALSIVRQYWGMTIKEANSYLDNILDFADKYTTNYYDWCAYPGTKIAELEVALKARAKFSFYND